MLHGIETLADLSQSSVDGLFKSIMESRKIKMGQVAQPVRVALTGRTVSPEIFEVIDSLEKEKVIYRLQKAMSSIK